MATIAICLTILLSAVLAEPDTQALLSSFSSYNGEQGTRAARDAGDFFEEAGNTINKEVRDILQPIGTAVVSVVSSQCSNVKKLVGVDYEQVKGEREPDLNQLTLVYINNDYTITYNLTTAARSIPEAKGYNPNQKLYIFIHGFNDEPDSDSFRKISDALLSTGECNVLALDCSTLTRWLYLRSSTYARFIGEKLGEVLAAMVKSGVDPDQIHVIGHSLGAHVAGFTGKSFTNFTNILKVGRITGLDPAGPCFSNVDEDLRLKDTDATFVDVMHTGGGTLGIVDAIGQADFFVNGGEQQPKCKDQSCDHARAWMYFAESVTNPGAFAAIQCDGYEAFKNKSCQNVISYMGYPCEPGTKGKFYLQTAGESPYGLGPNGTVYKNDQGFVKNITQGIFG